MNKFLKKFLLISGITIVVLLALGVGLAAIFQNKIGNQIIKEINKSLITELSVEDINISLFANFPNATANLNGVILKDNGGGNLLEAKKIAFRLGLFSLLGSNLKLETINIKEGAITILVDPQGQSNYAIFKESPEEDKSGSKDLAVSIQKASLEDIELIYDNESTAQSVSMLLDKANFSGQFSNTKFDLLSDAKFTSRFVDIGDIRYLPGKKIAYEANIQVNLEKGLYQFQNVVAHLGSNNFQVDGAIEQLEGGPFYDLALRSEDGNIQGILQLLPEEYLKQLGDFSSSGNLHFETLVRGQNNKNQNPEITVDLSLDEGRISSPRLSNDMKEVSFKVRYHNGKERSNKSSVLKIEGFKGYFNRELAEMELEVENFDQPNIDFHLDGALPLNAIYGLFNSPSISAGSGEIEIKDLNLQGLYEDMIQPNRISNVESSGILEFDDASLTINGEKMILDRGELSLFDNRLKIDDLRLEGAGSDLELSGTAFNLIPVLFADSLNSKNAELEFQVELNGPKLDIDRILVLSDLKLSEEDTSGAEVEIIDSLKATKVEKREQLTQFLNGTFKTNIASFNYNKLEGENFNGFLSFNNNEMAIRGSANAMDGIIQMDGDMIFEENARLDAKLICESIDMKQFLTQSNNFDQDILTDKNLSGKFSSHMLIYSFWDEKGNFLMDKLNVLAEVGIKEGNLKDFEMLESFSTFVKIKDLKEVQLVDLKNYLEIRHQTLYIPVMFIQSNAMNLTLSGEHQFSNEYEYNLKVNAGQVLINRFKKYDPTLQPVKARQRGFLNLHYKVWGNTDGSNFKSAKRQVKEEFDRSSHRKQKIEIALNKAFSHLRVIKEPNEWEDEGMNVIER